MMNSAADVSSTQPIERPSRSARFHALPSSDGVTITSKIKPPHYLVPLCLRNADAAPYTNPDNVTRHVTSSRPSWNPMLPAFARAPHPESCQRRTLQQLSQARRNPKPPIGSGYRKAKRSGDPDRSRSLDPLHVKPALEDDGATQKADPG